MTYDLVLRNGLVVDGSGLGSFRADVGIVGDRIATIGRIRARGREEIDADGLAVTPGFIDGHTHLDAQVFWDPIGANSCWHGVTSVVMGNCGFTLAPSAEENAALVVRNLERAEDISGKAMAQGIQWSWTTFAEYLDTLDRLPKGLNYAAQIGHSALRTYVMGERAFEESASEDDLRAMSDELRAALTAGAIGFSTSRTHQHRTSDDRPVASRIASWEEVDRLVHVRGEQGAYIFQFVEDPPDADRAEARWNELIALSASAAVPFAIPALAFADRILPVLDRCAERGGRMFGLAHCRGIGTMSSFRTQLPFDRLPVWRELRAAPRRAAPTTRERSRARPATRYERAREPVRRGGRRRSTAAGIRPHARARHAGPAESLGRRRGPRARPRSGRADDPRLARGRLRPVLRADAHALRSGRHPAHPAAPAYRDGLLGLGRARQPDVRRVDPDASARALVPGPRRLLLRGGNPHADPRAGPRLGLPRSRPRARGLVADLNVIDPATVAPAMPKVVHDLPAEKRIEQRSTGIKATIVGGQVLVRDGQHTGALPGRLLRRRIARD
ncbi:MAG: amidohydrolase family protein [Myxococcota bacterium]